MISRVFGHRSGRAIAAARATLACLFVLALLLDPSTSRVSHSLIAVTAAYALFAVSILAATWSNWWLECRLAFPTHIVDIVAALLLLMFTGGYASPFIGFSVFVVLTAAIRWPPRQALATTAAVVLASMIATFAADFSLPMQFGPSRFVVRVASLLVIALLGIWFGQNQFVAMRARFRSSRLESSISPTPPVEDSLEFALESFSARRALLAWTDEDEPWLHVATLAEEKHDEQRLPPDLYPTLFDEEYRTAPFLFDLERNRTVGLQGRSKKPARHVPVSRDFARALSISHGLAIPFRTIRHEGLLLLTDIDVLCTDDLAIAAKVGDQIAIAFERAAALSAGREASSAEARLALARDLHDGAIQFLAGMGLRLRVAKSAAGDADAVREQLGAIERDLLDQQKDLRDLIEKLRRRDHDDTGTDLCEHLGTLCKRLEAQWNVRVELASCAGERTITPTFRYQLDQVVREAVSNAVRHGSANQLRIEATVADGWLDLGIVDDGSGFPFKGAMSDNELAAQNSGPKSLQERLSLRGGSLRVHSSPAGARIDMRLPLESGA
jgi:signal transduction histidine kinase